MKFTPTAWLRTRASPGPGSPTSTSVYSSTSGPPVRANRIAFAISLSLIDGLTWVRHQLRQHQACAGHVGRARDVVDVAGAHQGVDVRLVRLRGHRVAQEDHAIDLAVDQLGADLQVAAHRT